MSAAGVTDRLRASLEAVNTALNPRALYLAQWEYEVIAATPGPPTKIDCAAQDPETAEFLPTPLAGLTLWPGPSGIVAVPQPGTIVRIGFINGDPTKPAIVGLDPAATPLLIQAYARLQVPTEHVITAEAACLIMYNFMAALMVAAGGGPLLAAVLQPLLAPAMVTALQALATPAPPGQAAQIIAAALQASLFTAGTVATTSSPFNAAIKTALAAKTPDVSGLFPSAGTAAIMAG